jgi:3-oxoacyl-[acyl-carrier-protein] synthase-3
MKQRSHNFGMAGWGLAFGVDTDVKQAAGEYVADPERVVRWGYHTFHRAPDGVSQVDLAREAAEKALVSVDLQPGDIDLLALAISEMPDYLHWDSSAGLARELKMGGTQTLLLTEGCASGVTGLGLVAGQFAVQPDLETVLFVAVNRVSEFHRNRMNVNNAVHSDGAVAVVCRRGHPRHQWLATEQFTDPEFADWFRNDFGGGVHPRVPEDWSSATAPAGHERVQAHFNKEPKRLKEFNDLLNARGVQVVEGACRRAGISRDEVTHVIYINDSPDSIEDISRPLGIPLERTNAALSVRHGHMGAADQLTSLAQLSDAGRLPQGAVVALCGISIGMRWYCTLVRV